MDVGPQCNVAVMGDMIDFSSNGIDAQGYLAVPENGSGPGVIVVQEWWGLDSGIKEMADRLAATGFVVLRQTCTTGNSLHTTRWTRPVS